MISKTVNEIHQMIGGNLHIHKSDLQTVVSGVCIDSREIRQNEIYFALKGNRTDGHCYIQDIANAGAGLAIISNDEFVNEPITTILVEDVEVALQTLARAYRESLKTMVIGVTGSNGKTSCKDILAAMLSSKFHVKKTQGNRNNELGVPLTILDFDEETEYAVVEMGMENLGDIHFLNDIAHPDCGIITNVGIAHLENLGSMENIGRAKLELVDGLKANSLFVYYDDDRILQKIIKEKDVRSLNVKTFGDSSNASIYCTFFSQTQNSIQFQTNLSETIFEILTLGKHQVLNAMAAILCAKSIGLSDQEIQSGLYNYESTSMRNELSRIGKAIILNDAYKSNPQSAMAALDTFQHIKAPYKIIVLADMLDLGKDTDKFHYDLGASLKNYDFDELLVYGELSKDILRGAQFMCPDKQYKYFNTHEEMYEYIKDMKNRSCAVLFKGSRGMALDKVVNRWSEN